MNNKIKMVFIGLSVMVFLGCNSAFNNELSFLKWIGQPENGFVKYNSANGFNLSLKYLPSDYVAFLEYNKSGVDSLQLNSDMLNEFTYNRTRNKGY